MKYLVCNVNPTYYNLDIYFVNEENNLSLIATCNSIANLIQMIPYYCEKNEVKLVQLAGPEAYLEGIKESILTYTKQEYSNLDLEIDCLETLE